MTEQPRPQGGTGDCWLELLDTMPNCHPMREDCVERRLFGIAKYEGQPVRRGDGRDEIRDFVEEMLDGAVYATRLRLFWLAHLLLLIAAYVRWRGR